jgi:4-hydroxybenzoate polyprenyltransferase
MAGPLHPAKRVGSRGPIARSTSAPLLSLTIRNYLELVRPANVVTALADVLAGYALAERQNHQALPWLLVATACLYAGGVVLNDYFDRNLDAVERPERPIPSGRVGAGGAAALGVLLLGAGVFTAAQATRAAVLIALAIAGFVVLYDAWGKRQWIGPANMGLCRALNLLLGVAAVPVALAARWPVALIPFVYIVAVTALSRGEVHGGAPRTAAFALVSLSAGLAGLAFLALRSEHALVSGVVLACLIARVVPPFLQARGSLEPARVRHAVKRGVLSLVLVNAVIGTAYAGPVYGALILVTALVAGWLARMFAVT